MTQHSATEPSCRSSTLISEPEDQVEESPLHVDAHMQHGLDEHRCFVHDASMNCARALQRDPRLL